MGESEEITEGSGGEDGQGDGTCVDETYGGINATITEDTGVSGKLQPAREKADSEKMDRRGTRGLLATSSGSEESEGTQDAINMAALDIQPRVREFANTPNGRKLAGKSLDSEKGQASEDDEEEEAGGATLAT